MTNHNELLNLIDQLLNGNGDYQYYEKIRRILPHYDSIWISTPSSHKATFKYSRGWHLFNNRKYEEVNPEHLGTIKRLSKFSREGVVRNTQLESIILKKLCGDNVDLAPFDEREIMFHSQLLSDAGKANGTYIIAPYFDFRLKSITEKGYEMIDDRTKKDGTNTININLS